MTTVGERIKQRRLELGLTQEQVGAAVGVSKATVQRYEIGEIEVRRTIAMSLAKILVTTPAWIMGWQQGLPGTATLADALPLVPIIGKISAGAPIVAHNNIVGYAHASVKNAEGHFYLRVNGDSMVNAGIKDGSLVLFEQTQQALSGQIVACLVGGEDATIKRFIEKGRTVLLVPENDAYAPITLSKLEFDAGYARILGVAKQVIIDL